MIEDEEGFLYPRVNEDYCVDCGLCEKVCPLVEKNNAKKGVLYSCIIQNKDKDILFHSTSGGGFTPIAEYVLNQGGIVFGVEMKNDDFFVKHVKIEKASNLDRFRNSKYVQSYLGNAFIETKKELDNGKLVCFSGTPCQIQGLKNYLTKDYSNLITVDVVCRGVPSPGVWEKYKNNLIKNGNVKEIVFRDKTLGYQYSTMKVEYDDGRVVRNGIESDQWLRMFFSGLILRPSCPTCNFRSVERCSDFTIWDCFNVSDITKDLNETKGATRMLIHSERGVSLFNSIRDEFYIIEAPESIIAKGIEDTFELNIHRNEFYKDYRELDFNELLSKWVPMSFMIKAKRNVRRTLNKIGIDLFVKKIKRRVKG